MSGANKVEDSYRWIIACPTYILRLHSRNNHLEIALRMTEVLIQIISYIELALNLALNHLMGLGLQHHFIED